MPTLKKSSPYRARKSATSVYLPRSAVSSTSSGWFAAAFIRRSENGARTVGRPTAASDLPMARGRAGGCDRVGESCILGLQFACQVIPFVGLDAHEMRALALLDPPDAAARPRAQHHRLGLAIARMRPAERGEAPGHGFDRHHQGAVGLYAVAVDPADQVVETEGRADAGAFPGRAL